MAFGPKENTHSLFRPGVVSILVRVAFNREFTICLSDIDRGRVDGDTENIVIARLKRLVRGPDPSSPPRSRSGARLRGVGRRAWQGREDRAAPEAAYLGRCARRGRLRGILELYATLWTLGLCVRHDWPRFEN